MNVLTVLWIGDGPWFYSSRPADMPPPDKPELRLFGVQDVIKYKRMVERHLPGCNFYCLSNVNVPGVNCIPLTGDLVGWWPKMELWRPDLPKGRTIYFDLDTLLVRGADEMVNFPAPFAAIEPGPDVGSDKKEPWLDQMGKWRFPKYQTSVMVWDTDYVTRFWDAFKPVHVEELASDQDFLGKLFPDEARMPTQWFTRIRRTERTGSMPRAKVVLTMRMHNDGAARVYPWARKIWR